ncbi:MAG: beta-galactosidase [Luteitalea sp.]|nr:beta-galactosidase [Luteitalea sp.]
MQGTTQGHMSETAGDRRKAVRRPGWVTSLLVVGVLAGIAGVSAGPEIATGASPRATLDLGGEWRFAVDPTRDGEASGWHRADPADHHASWDVVEVPHCWPLDPRYQYTGTAWYRKTFEAPATFESRHVRLTFGAVFARARVWLNGELLGRHEGGYTPFTFDVTRALRLGKPNVLAVEVDNSWSTTTLPGARPGDRPADRVYPWWDYGGIVRDVALVAHSPIFIVNQKIVATPDLAQGSASIDATVWVRNTGSQPWDGRLRLTVTEPSGRGSTHTVTRRQPSLETVARVAPGQVEPLRLRATLPKEAVRLWTLDRPSLYRMRAALETSSGENAATIDQHEVTFGIRRIEIRGTELLLNGEPVRLGGANRAGEHPRFGLIEPRDVVEADLRLMKTAGLELQRIVHYAAPPALLEAADRTGLLIIGEAGNWQLQPSQLDSPAIRADFQSQTREMIERDWNHPSVIGWSVGNEYASDTPSGVAWTKDMAAFVRALDPSRFVTFASFRADRDRFSQPEEEGSHYVDMVSVNMYGQPSDLDERIARVRARWPDKPIFVSEFGLRADKVKDEAERQEYFRRVIDVFRRERAVVGASIWSFNDYRSRYPDTAPNGYRPWGLVDHERNPRGAYETVQQELAVARLVAVEQVEQKRPALRVTVAAQPDFPSRPVEGLTVRVRVDQSAGEPDASARVPRLRPGEEAVVELPLPSSRDRDQLEVELLRPDGSLLDWCRPCALPTKSPS